MEITMNNKKYICPDCGTEMQKKTVTVITGTAVRLECPKCFFGISKSRYDAILNYGRNETETTADREKVEIPDKPPLGCKPYYIYIGPRIEDLCSAIVRHYAAGKVNHDKILLWCKEIIYLNEMYRNLRYDEKCKVWREDKDGSVNA